MAWLGHGQKERHGLKQDEAGDEKQGREARQTKRRTTRLDKRSKAANSRALLVPFSSVSSMYGLCKAATA